jgi:hypothetical protein
MSFTETAIAALKLPIGKTDHIEWDSDLPGFGVRLRLGRKNHIKKNWVVQYRVGPKQRRTGLGDTRKVRLADARRGAQQFFAKVRLGTDPVAEKEKVAARARHTLGSTVDVYLSVKRDKLRPGTYYLSKLHLTKSWKRLHKQPLTEITRADVALELQRLAKERGCAAASTARQKLSAFFNWAIGEGLVEHNPVWKTNDPALGIEPRSRVLDDNELVLIWQACAHVADNRGRSSPPLGDDFMKIVRLLILTGCRRSEIAQLARLSQLGAEIGVSTAKNA